MKVKHSKYTKPQYTNSKKEHTLLEVADLLLDKTGTAIEYDFCHKGNKIHTTLRKCELINKPCEVIDDKVSTFYELLDVCEKHETSGMKYGFSYKGQDFGLHIEIHPINIVFVK